MISLGEQFKMAVTFGLGGKSNFQDWEILSFLKSGMFIKLIKVNGNNKKPIRSVQR